MSSLNKVQLIGRLGKDVELKTLSSGGTVASFSIATSESWKDKATGEKKEKTEWHNIVLWNALADIAGKYLHKGDLVYIEGKMTTRSWDKDGVTRYTTEIVGSNLVMLGTKKQESAPPPSDDGWGSAPATKTESKPVEARKEVPNTDDLPF